MADIGIKSAAGKPIQNPLPASWLGRNDMPTTPPVWANIGVLTNSDIRNLLAQIGYDLSGWDYTLVNDNKVGRYQFTGKILEAYGLLASGSYDTYGDDCVNYVNAWNPTVVTNTAYPYENYFYNVTSLSSFLTSVASQEHLAYQRIVDLYMMGVAAGTILETDSLDVIAGMIYVSWELGVGTNATPSNITGTGAWAWRYFGLGDAANAFNSGRYSTTVLSA